VRLTRFDFDSPRAAQVGLPNDELFRRAKRIKFRGVYKTPSQVTDGECHLYVLCEAQRFNAQLPLTATSDGGGEDAAGQSKSRTRMFASEDFHLLGHIDAFTNLRSLQLHANARLRRKKGMYYVIQIDGAKLTDVSDITVVEDEDEPSAAPDEKVLAHDRWGSTSDTGDRVRVHGLINAEAIDRIWVADRAGEFGDAGAFLDCTPPGGHNVPQGMRLDDRCDVKQQ
jgi:zinc finger HIT domain-containing protein 1